MKTITITKNLYKFAELSDEAKEHAIEKLSDINVDYYGWWSFIYEDAASVGFKITSFDIGRANYCKGDFIDSAKETAGKIIKEHGDACNTYKLATAFLADLKTLEDSVTNDNEYEIEGEIEDLSNDFKYSLCEEYFSVLRQDYEYRISYEAITESIEANDYDFDVNGNLCNLN